MAIPVESFILHPQQSGTLQARLQQTIAQGILSGQFRKEGVLKTFNKQLLAWDVYEALRQQEEGIDRDPFAAIDKYKHPYFITGNLASKRRAFMVVAVLSAPQGALNMAFNQQLAFA